MNPNYVLERHPDLYFPDGDIVLAVQQTPQADDSAEGPPKCTLFRVHKFLLKHHSTTFSNFFADASAAPAETYDDVPLAEMYGDKAEDFALLLSYLYNPSSLVFKRNDPNTPNAVTGVARLADKYLIEPLHRRLVELVCDDWPTTLTEYDSKQGELDVLRKEALSILHNARPESESNDRQPRLADSIPEPASAILFAREFGCAQILPAAFYRLSLIPVAYDWSARMTHCSLARWSVLDGENLLQCMYGCQALRQYRPRASQFLSKYCVHADDLYNMDTPCYRFAAGLFAAVFSRVDSGEGEAEAPPATTPTHPDPLRLLDKCSRYWEMPEFSQERCSDQLCEECKHAMGKELVEERKRIWGELPRYFNVG